MSYGEFLSVCGEALIDPRLVAENLTEAGIDPKTMTTEALRDWLAENS